MNTDPPQLGDEVFVFWVDIESKNDAGIGDMEPRVFRTRGTYMGQIPKTHKGKTIDFTWVKGGDWDVRAREYREINAIPTTNVLRVQVLRRIKRATP